jgi:hypothetical protein
MFDVVESNDDDRQADDVDDEDDYDYGEHDDYYENLNKKHKQNMKQRLVELMESYLNMKMKKKTYLNSCLFYSIVDYLIHQ